MRTLFTRLSLCTATLAVAVFTPARPAKANRQLEGAISGAAERYLESTFGSEAVPYSKDWGKTARKRIGAKVVKVRKSKKVAIKIAGRKVGERTVHYWEPQTRSVYKNVNHGTWMRGTVGLGNDLNINIRNLRFVNNTLRFRVEAYANIRGSLEARVYTYDRRLGSTRIRGRGRVRILIDMSVSFRRVGNQIQWKTKADSSNVKIVSLTVDRVSHFGGATARLIGDAAHGMFRYWATKKYNNMRRRAASAVAKAVARDGRVKLAYGKLAIR